uniref:Putative secreted protein n=2 Tax=Ixodes ricinus TaxID=34613 RepID=A0A6B0VCR3_IXORI
MLRCPRMPLIVSIVGVLCSVRLCNTEDIITAPQQCSGTFRVHSTQVTLFIQQNVTSENDVLDCQFTFVAPGDSGLLFFVNDITAIDDGEIPGCPVEIYGDVADPPVTSLCGHYPTLVVPVTSSKAVVLYRPVYQGSPYTLTVDLQVTTSDDVTTQLCADAELYAVPSVPLKYGIVFRDDGGSHDAEEFCEIKVFSSDADESLKTRCLLTSDGVCRYEVRLNNGSVLPEADQVVGITDARGEVTVRLYPSGLAGVLGLTLPAEFEPVDKLETPPSVPTESSANVTVSADVDFNVTDSIVTEETTTVGGGSEGTSGDGCGSNETPSTIWGKTKKFFDDAGCAITSAWNTVTSAVAGAFDVVASAVTSAANTVVSAVTSAWDSVTSWITSWW